MAIDEQSSTETGIGSEVTAVPALSLHSYLKSKESGQSVPVIVDGAKFELSFSARQSEQPGCEQIGTHSESGSYS